MNRVEIDRFIVDCPSFEDFRQRIAPLSNKEKGDITERLAQVYLQTAPEYRTALEKVWLLREVPASVLAAIGLPRDDKGIDLIALDRKETYWVIQAKYRTDEEEALGWGELSTSFGLASPPRRNISLLVVIHTTARPISNRDLMGTKLVEIGLDRWRQADWSLIRRTIRENVPARPIPSTPTGRFDWQQTVIDNAVAHFRANARGRAQLPCGTGKSLIAYFIANAMQACTVIVAVPSLNLIKQTVGVWLREEVARGRLTDWLCVASDESVGKVSKVGQVDDIADERPDLGLPTTTDENEIADWLRRPGNRKVVFTTYQSSAKLAQAAKIAGVAFELVVLDEAHRTAGARDREFVTLLHDDKVKTRRRLFMTATERKIRSTNGDSDIDVLFSMDDNVEDYGARFYTMSFKEAIECGIIADYRIVTYFVKESEVEELIKKNRLLNLDDGLDPVAACDVATAVATKRVMGKEGVKHPLVFAPSISASIAFQRHLDLLNKFEIGPVSTNFHVDSGMSAGKRADFLEQFIESPIGVMCNAGCLTEGVDVPGIDAVVFAAPKQSIVNIIQASGRALRKAKGKERGYIVIPIDVPDGMDYAEYAETTQFRTISRIVTAMSTQDDRIVEQLRARFNGPNPNGGGKPRERVIEIGGDVPVGFKITLDEVADSIEAKLWERVARVNFRTFEEARKFGQSSGAKTKEQWDALSMADKLPADIPANPDRTYASKGWTGWGDFLGTGYVATKYRVYLSYEESREWAHSSGIKSQKEWFEAGKSGRIPDNIPVDAQTYYKDNGWVSWGDFLGTGTVAPQDRDYLSYPEASAYAKTTGATTREQWKKLGRDKKLPSNIPARPDVVYENNGWVSWDDFLGTGRIVIDKVSFEEGRAWARSDECKFKTVAAWKKAASERKLPPGLPANPAVTYANKGWTSYGDWFGTGRIRSKKDVSTRDRLDVKTDRNG